MWLRVHTCSIIDAWIDCVDACCSFLWGVLCEQPVRRLASRAKGLPHLRLGGFAPRSCPFVHGHGDSYACSHGWMSPSIVACDLAPAGGRIRDTWTASRKFWRLQVFGCLMHFPS